MKNKEVVIGFALNIKKKEIRMFMAEPSVTLSVFQARTYGEHLIKLANQVEREAKKNEDKEAEKDSIH